MSSGLSMELPHAQVLAEQVRAALAPFCDRIEIAGSIRRQRPLVRDIEIVCIPRQEPVGLFDEITLANADFCRAVNAWQKVKGEAIGKYTQRILPGGVTLDLFIAHPNNWGLIFAIRTGNRYFSYKALACGWARAGYHSDGGMLYKDGKPIPIREERELFDLAGVPWTEPRNREE